jgi:hypothetical protein
MCVLTYFSDLSMVMNGDVVHDQYAIVTREWIHLGDLHICECGY